MKLIDFLKKQIDSGRQAYVVYPLIKESEKLDFKDLMDGYETFSRDFPMPEYNISIVHGRMKKRREIMRCKDLLKINLRF